MKFERIAKPIDFVPIAITLENLREAKVLLSALILGEQHMRAGNFRFNDQSIARDFIDGLRSEGIREI